MKTVFASSVDYQDDVTFIVDATSAIDYEFWGEFFHSTMTSARSIAICARCRRTTPTEK